MSSTITISKETLDVFKALYEVDQSLRIDHEMTETKDDDTQVTILRSKTFNNTTMARIEIAEVFPRDVNIYDLREFISVVSIVNEPVFDLSNDKFIMIKSADGKQKLRYLEANPDLINSYSDKDPKLSQDDVQFVITEAQFKSVLTAAQTLKFEYVGFVSDGEKLVLTAFNKNHGDDQETNTYSIMINEGECSQTFKMIYKLQLQNISILSGEGDLFFTIDGSRKISKILTSTGKTYWISFDASSEFDA